jgi:hypothetical protein
VTTGSVGYKSASSRSTSIDIFTGLFARASSQNASYRTFALVLPFATAQRAREVIEWLFAALNSVEMASIQIVVSLVSASPSAVLRRWTSMRGVIRLWFQYRVAVMERQGRVAIGT